MTRALVTLAPFVAVLAGLVRRVGAAELERKEKRHHER